MLRVSADAEEGFEVDKDARASLHLPKGFAAGAFAELALPFGSLEGWISAADVELFLAKPVVFDGYAVPSASAVLQPREVSSGRVRVAFEPSEQLKPMKPLVHEVACGDLRASRGSFESKPLAAVPLYWGELAVGSEPLYKTVGGAIVAELVREPDESAHVSVHEVDGAHVRVVHHHALHLAFGWIRAAAVKRLPEDADVFVASGSVGSPVRGYDVDHWTRRICPYEVPLVLVHPLGEAVIGTLSAHVPFRTFERSGQTEGSTSPFSHLALIGKPWIDGKNTAVTVPQEIVDACPPPKD